MNKVIERLNNKAIIAHRGYSKIYPENTFASFDAAYSCGADLIELDARTTKDGEVVVFHDEDLQRIFGINIKLSEIEYAKLESLRIKEQKIPKLLEVLEKYHAKIPFLIEIKSHKDVEKVLEICKAFKDWIAIISFEIDVLEKAKKDFVTGILYYKPPGLILEAKRKGYGLVLPKYTLATEKAVSFAHRLGLKVIAWTVNEEKLIKRLWEIGVDGIATDDVELAINIKKSL